MTTRRQVILLDFWATWCVGPPVGYPTSFIIDREGKICASHTGFAPKETFEQEILPLL